MLLDRNREEVLAKASPQFYGFFLTLNLGRSALQLVLGQKLAI